MKLKLIYLILYTGTLFGSGGYDNGTATGKGQFQLDLTWNPFDRFDFGQTYVVMSYGLTNRLDLHGYISHHKDGYQSWYSGIFYQFLKTKRLDLATAAGIRRRFNQNWTHVFLPQLLYNAHLTERISIGGSLVDVRNEKLDFSYGTTVDVAVFYQLKYETNKIESISIGMGGFHPATWNPNAYFLPTYSLDIKFK